MAVYDKADFYASYGVYLTYPDGRRLAGYRGPEFEGAVTIRLHYHPLVQKRNAEIKADKIIAQYGITSSDKVMIFGAGFGWLGEALTEKTGCKSVGVELSQYIHDTKDTSPDDELQEAIEAGGLSITKGDGLKVFTDFKQGNVARTSVTLLQETLSNKRSRDTIKGVLKSAPTHIITEEVWQTLNDMERESYNTSFTSIGGEVIHIIEGAFV